MFTGIITDMGVCVSKEDRDGWTRLIVRAPQTAERAEVGGSVCVAGACLTVTRRNDTSFSFDLLPETIRRTTFAEIEPGDSVNLELPMRLGDELGGHLVYGHVDGQGEVVDVRKDGESTVLTVRVPAECSRFTAMKGSIAFDGVSLTIAGLKDDLVSVCLIPYTLTHTTLGQKQVGDRVHVEADMILKYLGTLCEKYLAERQVAF